ncbi:MAG: aminoacyl-tRNA hydrolase [Betaproteobacteria bacterium]
MRFVVGLGNPGERYRRTRHNAGFLALDVLAARARAAARLEADAWLAEASLGGERVLLVKPLSFMNRSGEPLVRLLSESGGSPADLVVVVDDVALELGTVRVRARGSDGGHNGLRSVADALGTTDFARVRIGVRDAGTPIEQLPLDLAAYVLSDFPEPDAAAVEAALALAADAVVCLLRDGTEAAMNDFNGRHA